MANLNRFLQLRRNEKVYPDRSTAKSEIESKFNTGGTQDGEPLAVRYYSDSGKTNMAVLVAHTYDRDGKRVIIYNDADLKDGLYKYVGYEDGKIFHDAVSGTSNLKPTSSVTEALLALDKVDNNQAKQIGAPESAETINPLLTGYLSANTIDSVIDALNKLNAIDENIAAQLGTDIEAFQSISGYLSSDYYISGCPNVMEVFHKLNEAILNNVPENILYVLGITKGDYDIKNYHSGETYLDGVVNVNSALTKLDEALTSADTKVSNLEKVVGVTSADTAITSYVTGTSYIKDDTTVVDALKTLDGKVKDDSDAIGAEGHSAITEYITGTTFISGASTVVSALTALDNAAKALSADSINFEEIVGVDRHSANLSGLTGSILSAITDPTVLKALNALDNKVKADDDAIGAEGKSAITEYVTGSTFISDPTVKSVVDALNKLDKIDNKIQSQLGTDIENESGLTPYLSGTNFISGCSDVMSALTTLDTAILNNVPKNILSALGITKEDWDILSYHSGDTYIKECPTVNSALTKIDEVLYSADTKASNLEKVIGVTSGDSAITDYHIGEAIISGANSVNSALTLLNNAVEELSGKGINFEEIVGVERDSTSFTGLSGYCLSAISEPTVLKALNKLDDVIIANEEVTSQAIGTIVNAAGFSKSPIGYEVDDDKAFISATTNIKEALANLNDAIEEISADSINFEEIVGVDRKSGNLTGLTGSTLSTLTNKTVKDALNALDDKVKADDDAIGANGKSSIKNSLTGTNYISGASTVVSALTALDDQIKDNSDAIGANGNANIKSSLEGTNYISGNSTVVFALKRLDNVLSSADTKVSNLEKVIGVGKDDTEMVGLSGYCLSAISEPTVLKALNKLDDVIVENEEIIVKAISAITSAAGFDTDPNISYSVDGTKKYISGSTNIKESVVKLNDALQSHLQISAVTEPLKYDKTTETLSLPFAEKSHIDYESGEVICKNIISGDSNGIYALADLHYSETTNTLMWYNTNGSREIKLTGFKGIKGTSVDSINKTLTITFEKSDGSTIDSVIPLKDLLTEYDFNDGNPIGTTKSKDAFIADHNVNLLEVEPPVGTSGTTQIYGDIEIFDCGEY